MKYWQERLLDDLISYFESREEVSGLLLFGSLSNPEPAADHWSDIDLLVVVKDGEIDRFFPAVDWIASFGTLYTYSQSADDFRCTTRACFENFNRVDFVMTTEGKLADLRKWPEIPFSAGVKVLFSHAEVVDALAARQFVQSPALPATQEQFLELVRDFRFKSMLAVYKVTRNDLLIASHLTYDLARDCCVLAMMLRDRVTGTNRHKDGGMGNQYVQELEGIQGPPTSLGLLERIMASHQLFERLACEWSASYQENRHLLFDWIEQARARLHRQ